MTIQNEAYLQLLMDNHMTTDNGWITAKPELQEDQDNSVCLHCVITDLQETQAKLLESTENLASEIWTLKGTVDFLTKIIQGK